MRDERFPLSLGRGLAAVKVLQETFMADVEEYDVRPDGEIDIVMSLPTDPRSRTIILSRSRVMRNHVALAAARAHLDRAKKHAAATRAFLAAARYAPR